MKSKRMELSKGARKVFLQSIFSGILFCGLFNSHPGMSQVTPRQKQQIDSLFSQWDSDSTPGMELLILSKGRVILDKPFGFSDIALKKFNSSKRKMWVASVSKQFTALAVALLVNKNMIDLEDDVRKYLPELPFPGDTVKIKHLVYHTSGLREGFTLTAMSFKTESEYTNENVFKYLCRQQGRNFRPGDRFEYNNSGYVLLAMIVEKVSKLPFPDFVQQFIFAPLGMKDSRFYAAFPKNDSSVAIGYAVTIENNRKRYLPTNFKGSTYGSSGLVTTAADLAKWDRVFYEPVFGERVKQLQIQRGKLNNGQLIPYAFGLEIEPYRNKKAITHSGVDPGYKAEILRFPGESFSIICLANTEDAYGLTNNLFKIAESFIHFDQPVTTANKPVCKPAPGPYINVLTNAAMKFVTVNKDVSIADAPDGYYQLLAPSGHCSFTVKDILLDAYHFRNDTIAFTTRAESAVFKAIKNATPAAGDVQSAAGAWYSAELDATYHLYAKDGILVLKFFDLYDIPLTAYENNLYAGEFLGTNMIQFVKNAAGEIEAMQFNREGIRDLLFKKL